MTESDTGSQASNFASSTMAIGPEIKDFKIPCLMRLDRLIRQHPDLDIDNVGPILLGKSNGHGKGWQSIGDKSNGTTKRRSKNLNGQKKTDNKPNNHFAVSSSGNGTKSNFDAIFYKKESTKASNSCKTARPSSRSSVVSSASKSSACVASSSSRVPRSSKEKRNGLAHRDGPSQSASTTIRTSGAGRNKRNKQIRERRTYYPDIIDTNYMVDDTIVSFLPEFCQKANITDLPDDPMDLCENFTIFLPHFDLSTSETPPHDKDDEMLSTWKARAFESIN